ncbi:MAG: helix-turn-helix transcriptional regulator [Oligosphaeraceae bacterium]|nr:helix-turn-helix transcriptional regulator [Oligosphaeraceae bacterium]
MFRDELKQLLQNLSSAGADFFTAESPAPGDPLPGCWDTPFYPPESHPACCEIIMLTAGELALHLNGSWYRLAHARPQFLLAGTRHSEHYLHPQSGYDLFWLTITPHGLNLHRTMYLVNDGYRQSPKRFHIFPPRSRTLWECIRSPRVDTTRCHYLLMQCLDDSLKEEQDSPGNYHADVVEQVRKYLEEYYCQPISLRELGEMTHYSPGHLNCIFQKALGLPIYRYLSRVRLAHAARLLASGTVTVREAAAAVGIPDQLYFSRCFRQHQGITPSAWRRTNSPQPAP